MVTEGSAQVGPDPEEDLQSDGDDRPVAELALGPVTEEALIRCCLSARTRDFMTPVR